MEIQEIYDDLKQTFGKYLEFEKGRDVIITSTLLNYEFNKKDLEINTIINKLTDEEISIYITINNNKLPTEYTFIFKEYDLYKDCIANLLNNVDYLEEKVDLLNECIENYKDIKINIKLQDFNIESEYLRTIFNKDKIDIITLFFLPIVYYKYSGRNSRLFENINKFISSQIDIKNIKPKDQININNFYIMIRSMTIDELKELARYHNEDKKSFDKIRMSQDKPDIIKDFESVTTNEEKLNLYNKYINKLIDKLFLKSKDLINGTSNKEKIQTINTFDNGYEFYITGFQWEVKTSILIDKGINKKCTCGIFKSGGECYHLFAISLYWYNQKGVNTFPFEYEPESIDTKSLNVFEDKPIIEFQNYHIYKSVKGYNLKFYWFGEYTGTKIVECESESEMFEDLKEKVYDLITKKVKSEHKIRYMISDKYDILKKLVYDDKYYKKFKKLYIENFNKDFSEPIDLFYELGGE